MKSVKVKLSYLSMLLLLWAWFDGCEGLIDSSLPEIFYPFGSDQGDSLVNSHRNFAGAIEIPYRIFNFRKLYVRSACRLLTNEDNFNFFLSFVTKGSLAYNSSLCSLLLSFMSVHNCFHKLILASY